MTEMRECLQCGTEFQVVRHPLVLCPACEQESQQVKRQVEWNVNGAKALSWIAVICGVTGMVLALFALLK
jgi:hypothetical protein